MKVLKNIKSQGVRQSGFSLLEVMISIAVTSVGLFGLAGVQAVGLNNNHSAYQSSQATVLAYDIADRMRANASAVNSYLSSSMTPVYARSLGAQAGCISTSGCSAAQMAQNDLYEWDSALTAALPGASASITLASGIYTVSINWDDNRDGEINDEDADFQVSFQL